MVNLSLVSPHTSFLQYFLAKNTDFLNEFEVEMVSLNWTAKYIPIRAVLVYLSQAYAIFSTMNLLFLQYILLMLLFSSFFLFLFQSLIKQI